MIISYFVQRGSQRSGCQKGGLRERVGCATLPFTETSSAEGGNPEKKVFRRIVFNPYLELFPHILYSQEP